MINYLIQLGILTSIYTLKKLLVGHKSVESFDWMSRASHTQFNRKNPWVFGYFMDFHEFRGRDGPKKF